MVFGRGGQHAVGLMDLLDELLDASRQAVCLEILVEQRQA